MTVLTLLRAELRRLVSTPLARLALVALMFVPVLYGGLYLWANRDPYAALDQVPAALVVADEGTTVDGESVDYGADIADGIVKAGTFDWHEVSAADADTGLRDGEYDFSITLPADFSAALASSSGDAPRQGIVVLETDDTNSYLASTIAKQAAQTIRTQIAEQVGEAAANRFLMGFADVRDSLSDAATGADRLASGTGSAATGAAQLASGTAELSAGASRLVAGLDDLADAASGLPSSTARLASGAAGVSAGASALSSSGAALASSSSAVVAGYSPARSAAASQLLADGLSQAQVDAALGALDQYGTAVSNLNGGVQALTGRLPALANGSAEVASGAQQLSSAAPDLVDGIDAADSGAAELATGSSTAADGASRLATGVTSLQSGAADLAAGLRSGLADLPDEDSGTRGEQASTIADPVAVRTTAVAQADDYGAGLAPFFLSLAAWIGIYALFLIVRPLSRRAITALTPPWKVTLAGWLAPALLGVIEAVALFLVTTLGLGFDVASPVGMLGFMALAAMTFASILLALNALLGSVGQFLGLVLMVVQLVTAGGTFPWQTLPGPLAWLHHVLPMSFSVDGLRQLMYGGSASIALSDAGVLACWLAGALLVTFATSLRMTRFRTVRDLRPSLIG